MRAGIIACTLAMESLYDAADKVRPDTPSSGGHCSDSDEFLEISCTVHLYVGHAPITLQQGWPAIADWPEATMELLAIPNVRVQLLTGVVPVDGVRIASMVERELRDIISAETAVRLLGSEVVKHSQVICPLALFSDQAISAMIGLVP